MKVNNQEFEDIFVQSPRRLHTLRSTKHLLRLLAGELFVLAVFFGLLWAVLK